MTQLEARCLLPIESRAREPAREELACADHLSLATLENSQLAASQTNPQLLRLKLWLVRARRFFWRSPVARWKVARRIEHLWVLDSYPVQDSFGLGCRYIMGGTCLCQPSIHSHAGPIGD